MSFYTYDPKSVLVSVHGKNIQGFSEDAMVEITPLAAVFESVVGADGEVTRVRSHDARVTVKVSLMQSSEGNRILGAILKQDMESANGASIGTVQIEDTQGRTLVSGAEGWVKGYPTQTFGKKVNTREWELEIAHAVVDLDVANA